MFHVDKRLHNCKSDTVKYMSEYGPIHCDTNLYMTFTISNLLIIILFLNLEQIGTVLKGSY